MNLEQKGSISLLNPSPAESLINLWKSGDETSHHEKIVTEIKLSKQKDNRFELN